MADFSAVYFDGEWRVLAYIPSDNNHDFPKYSSRVGFADSEIKEIDLRWYANRLLNQGST